MKSARKILGNALLVFALSAWSALGQIPAKDIEEIIHYDSSEGLGDPVFRLQQELLNGKRTLKFEREHGYLLSLLKGLQVPVSSQTLVFSKTSSQAEQISPRTPRALYFSSDVYVGWAPGCPVIDLVSMDPERGPIFYTLEQRPDPPAKFSRRLDCLRCHEAARTRWMPGLFVRSVRTGRDGTPLATVQEFTSGHSSSLAARWAGWYVSGTHVSEGAIAKGLRTLSEGHGEFHLGNLFSEPDKPDNVNVLAGANITDLRPFFDAPRYLSRHSDIVALLVLEHQVGMHNLITRAGYETRFAVAELERKGRPSPEPSTLSLTNPWPEVRIAQAGEDLLTYMLLRDEAPLHGPIAGTSSFANDFQLGGPIASRHRSLRELDLKTRLFHYPCSFLIYSSSFDGLPPLMKNYLWCRLEQILKGKDATPSFSTISAEDRKSVLEILRQTKPEFAAWLGR